MKIEYIFGIFLLQFVKSVDLLTNHWIYLNFTIKLKFPSWYDVKILDWPDILEDEGHVQVAYAPLLPPLQQEGEQVKLTDTGEITANHLYHLIHGQILQIYWTVYMVDKLVL